MKQRESVFRHQLVALLPRAWRFAMSLTGNVDACNDLVQAACERALSRYGQWRPGSRLDSWFFTIIHSIWMNELRAQKIRQGAGFVDPDHFVFENAGLDGERALQARQILRAVAALPEAQRAAVLLVYGEGYEYAEAAAILEVPTGTVMSRLARARVRLAELLPEEVPYRNARSREHQ